MLPFCPSLGLMGTSTRTSPRQSAATDSPPPSAAELSTLDGTSTQVCGTHGLSFAFFSPFRNLRSGSVLLCSSLISVHWCIHGASMCPSFPLIFLVQPHSSLLPPEYCVFPCLRSRSESRLIWNNVQLSPAVISCSAAIAGLLVRFSSFCSSHGLHFPE